MGQQLQRELWSHLLGATYVYIKVFSKLQFILNPIEYKGQTVSGSSHSIFVFF